MTQEQLNKKVLKWGSDKGILAKATLSTQFSKTEEEVEEISYAIEVINNGHPDDMEKANHDLKDAIGDTMVTLTLLAEIAGTNVLECYEMAYNEIKNRTGKMKNGVFVKDSTPNKQ